MTGQNILDGNVLMNCWMKHLPRRKRGRASATDRGSLAFWLHLVSCADNRQDHDHKALGKGVNSFR